MLSTFSSHNSVHKSHQSAGSQGLGAAVIFLWVTDSFRFCTPLSYTAWRVKMNEGEKSGSKQERKVLSKAEWRGGVSFWALSVIENKTLDLFYEE